MMFTKPTEFSFANMDEDSAKKALSVMASFFYIQDGGVQWLNENLSQFGCTADGLVNEALVDPELTQHQVCQDLHHAYRLHINPDDEDAAAYETQVPTTGGKGKSAHPYNKPIAYAAIHPQVLVEQALNARLAKVDEVPIEEQFLGDATELEASECEPSVTDQLVNQPEYESSVADYSDYQSEPEDFVRSISNISDDDDSDDEDYIEKSVTNFDELTYEQQLALTIEASLKEDAPQKYNNESSGTNNQLTPPPSQQKTAAKMIYSGGKSILSPRQSSSGKHIFPASSHTTPCPSSLNRKREHDDYGSHDDEDYIKPTRRPTKKLTKSITKSSVRAPASSSTSVTTAPVSSSLITASGSPHSLSPRKASSKPRKTPRSSRKSGPTSKPRRSAWTDDETFKLYKCLVKRREIEAKLPGLVKLYDAPLWKHISEELASVHGIHRAPGGCKSNWNRNGREFYDFDERSVLKRSKSLATSVQVPKKDRKGKKPVAVDEIDDDE
ncbi:uncharacterized protein Bfra_005264 [Botrytis fragariae]|uniref:Myb-like domain-containing protein n=1 Tax=Botrytis fragariae TaxID=1964551 RepID=A0A8H6EIT0_9HELO|nr:uncharacterized protein Bfra_005264 [Botrytis fragariae]KAF5873797.1 hypothetical protein Bfra_005264 [Botrytis fragariae]